MDNRKLSGEFDKDIALIDSIMRTEESFDLVKRILKPKNGQRCAFFYIAGFANGQVVQDFMRYCLNADNFRLEESTVPFVEASASGEIDAIIKSILAGMTCFVAEGTTAAMLMDMRNMPVRGVEEPENDKVLRGARDASGRRCSLTRR